MLILSKLYIYIYIVLNQWRNWGLADPALRGAHGNLGPLVRENLIPVKKKLNNCFFKLN
jgi:hypothetical protein